ncbi:type IX secretion system membrane protein PorP/SprF [Pedobacter sp. JCM 36344]|uniref:PorP/SprF family type IX secretion system membrane protein n=1 Tax=Pedobacter sp. JCM 36344 TaxID=3374280 RepID=UPI00397D6AE4
MKLRASIFTILVLLSAGSSAQQRPQYTQYIFNNYLLNPALSGMENYTDLRFGYRKQWTGIQDAPQTSFVSANFSLGDQYLWRNALSLPDKGDDPMSRNYMQNYTSSPSHHGLGVIAVLDDVGPLSRLDASLTYAYHLQLNNSLNFSVGIAAGISRIGLDRSQLSFESGGDDPAISRTIIGQVKPDLGLGVWLYGANFFAGASVQQILPQKLVFTASPTEFSTGKEVPHLFLTAGYRFFVAEDIAMTPSVMVKQVNPTPVSIDANLKVAFRDRFWLGGSYRKSDSFSAIAGVNINKTFNLTYSYDFTTSQLNTVSNGSHEIVLGIQLNNVYEVMSSMKMW